ncbi:efflux RND transporter periplasmic adaptor subunit [Plebeiibacterium marinum]|uniref:Efflux RND transporter periplasmic adaptor subunit n=1 Tax=Plebeiibacterium marinum TaxID=2992111 RepID=A0AAE3MHL0_9BACT|nr:efflux RND transporter periplasmic adaptor subunit [Plebeiobacterium marinum]MCW3807874.1 efflux RND transporter periplasmic adaptor subunit [Plebeiobacterium marinum]
MKRKKIIIYAAVSSIVLAALLAYSFTSSSKSGYVFETTRVERGSVSNTITATGTLEATNTVVVGTQVSGVIEKLYVDFNSVVSKGQLIAELDRSTLKSTLENAEADFDKAQAEYDYQRKNLERMKMLYNKNVLSQSDFDQAEYSYKLSRAALKSSSANVDKAERNLGYASIYAPIDGVVLNRAVEEGQTVAASMNTPELFTITNDLSIMQVEADVDEADIGLVQDGQDVDFTVDAFPDDTFSGKISEIRLQPNESSNVITYTVIVTVENPDKKLKPGMTASITAYVEQANNVLLVTGKAIRFKPEREMMMAYFESLPEDQKPMPPGGAPGTEGNGMGAPGENAPENPMQGPAPGEMEDNNNSKTLWIKEGNMIKPIHVETGINDGTKVEIISGLSQGDEIVISMSQGKVDKTTSEETSDDDEQSSPFMPTPPKGKGGPPR